MFGEMPFQNLHARVDRAAERFDIMDGERKFGELRFDRGRWNFLGTDIQVTHCIVPRLRRLGDFAPRAEALAAIRAGTVYYLGAEDDIDETFTDEGRALIREYREQKVEFEMSVDSDSVEIIKPVVDRLREIERQLHLLPYRIGGSIYDGLGNKD